MDEERLQPWLETDDSEEEDDDEAEDEPIEDHEYWETRWLVPIAPNAPIVHVGFQEAEVAGYDPLKHLNLHRDFANLELTEASILSFANHYGWLGVHVPRLRRFSSEHDDVSFRYGENFDDWAAHILVMRSLLKLWDILRDAEEATAEELEHIVQPDGACVFFNPEYIGSLGDYAPDRLSQDHYLEPSGIDRDAPITERIYYKWLMTSLLKGHLNYLLGQLTHPAVDLTPGAQLQLVPNNLLGAMYVMFLQEVMGKTVPPVRCFCGRWFSPQKPRKEGSRQRGRMDREYCSNGCRQQAYRLRKKTRSLPQIR